jgi:hypothetical protein
MERQRPNWIAPILIMLGSAAAGSIVGAITGDWNAGTIVFFAGAASAGILMQVLEARRTCESPSADQALLADPAPLWMRLIVAAVVFSIWLVLVVRVPMPVHMQYLLFFAMGCVGAAILSTIVWWRLR